MLNVDQIIMDQEQIKAMLPHRDPLLLVDAVHEIVKNERIVASRLLRESDPVFAGHFPGNPIYPGVYYVESIAQTGAILIFSSLGVPTSLGVLTTIENARFRRPTKPGDTLYYEVTLEKSRGSYYWVLGKVWVRDELVAEAKISMALVTNK